MTAAKLPHLNRAQRRALDRAAKRRAALAKPAPLPSLPRPIRTARPQTPLWLIAGALAMLAVLLAGGAYVIADAAGLLPNGGVTYTCPKGARCDD